MVFERPSDVPNCLILRQSTQLDPAEGVVTADLALAIGDAFRRTETKLITRLRRVAFQGRLVLNVLNRHLFINDAKR